MNSAIRLRSATLADARKIWEWRNEPATRAASFHSEPIPYEEHARWFEGKIDERATRFFIAVDVHGRDLGYVRLDLTGDTAEINLSIGPEHRGKGIGKALIRAAAEFALKELHLRSVVAHVKLDNPASLAAFRHAGFSLVVKNKNHDADSAELVYEDS